MRTGSLAPLSHAPLRNLLFAVALAACTTQPSSGSGPKLNVQDNAGMPFDHPPVGTTGAGSSSSHAQRLTVAQLRDSLPVVLGTDSSGAPVTWMIGNNVGFTARSATLGAADYLARVDDDLEPSPLYVKFMFDMAHDACNRVITADAAKAQGDRTLTRYTDVNQNLRALRLAFHGVKVPDGDDTGIASYRKLYDDALAGSNNNPTEGWRAVCVALLTAPEYHFY